jgi:iron complex transport system substrate-binding protein
VREIQSKRFFSILWGLLVVLLCLTLSGCNQESTQESQGSSSDPDHKTGEAKRIICAAPSVTEIVFALGIGGRVVGVSDFSTHPPEALTVPKIGGLIDPNKERITALQPDLLIIQGQNESLARFCAEHGIRFLSIEINTLEDIWTAIHTIGQTLKAEEKARALVQKNQRRFSGYQRQDPQPPS